MDYEPLEPEQEPIRPERYEILDSDGRPVALEPRESHRHSPYVSIAIIVICASLFAAANLLFPLLAKNSSLGISEDALLISLTFSPGYGMFLPGIITHMFAHADIWHLIFNMLMLFFLGTVVEERYGPWRFVVLYLGAGLFAAMAQAAFFPLGLLLGASGALAGVLAAFVRHYPHARLLLWGILPMPAWMLAVLWIGYNIYEVVRSDPGKAGIAFMAHIAGFVAGMVISILMYPPRDRRAGSH